MKYKIFWGIDPGGGIAAMWPEEGSWIIETWVMPDTTKKLVDLLEFISVPDSSTIHVTVEEVRMFTRQTQRSCDCGRLIVESKLHKGMTNFLKSAGATIGILSALKLAHEEIAPRTWQAAFGLLAKRGERLTTTEKKNRNKEKAKKIWPKLADEITHAVADAMLLAEFGRMTHR